jgi:N-acetylneuraminic acid mutarotase
MQTSIVLLASIILSWPYWNTKAPLPQSLSGSGCAVLNDTIYVIGGRDTLGNRYATNYIYDPVTDTWTTKTSMPTPRAHLGSVVVGGKIYAVGGWVGSTATGVIEEYDPVSDTWIAKTPMPTPRYTLAIAAAAEKIYVIGGMNMQGQIFNTVEEYDPSTDIWTTKAFMPTQRMGSGCGVINDTIYVFGGSTMIGGGDTTVNECYDPGTDTWAPRASMLTARYALGGFAFGNNAYAIGGYDYWSYHTVLEQYDPSMNMWSTLEPMQYARQSVAVGLIGDFFPFVYVIGGWNNGALNYNEEAYFGNAIEEYTQVPSVIFCRISPNPFRSSTEIRFEALSNSKIDSEIYDVSGRLVRTLRPDVQRSTLLWDGKDDNGSLLPNGTYLLVMNSNGITKTERIVLVR